ncbi:hypothetical protein BP6252_11959 [Coleophoma cylindrospora]|uniref:Carbohydrate-binding module family 18 protein n=1 Tax=Coleophoma cylindrospora TaxID=1849047 RepID=A0A3D8QFE4_9HELO|nr:hypothetical protein BP6252_11959 [Coleophoma cylindrospora]
MPSTTGALTLLACAVTVVAHGDHGNVGHHFMRREETKYTTITGKTVIPTTALMPKTIDTVINTAGVKTLIPGYLTMAFQAVPAYVYIETQTMGPTFVTSTFVTRTPVVSFGPQPTSRTTKPSGSSVKPSSSSVKPSSSSVKPSSSSIKPPNSTAKPSSSSVKPSSPSVKPSSSSIKPSSKTSASSTNKPITPSRAASITTKSSAATASAASASPTCCFENNNTVTPNSGCDGKPDGTTCGSFHTCYKGGCYWFNNDGMCGSLTNSCNTEGGFSCVSGTCTDIMNDPNNCGLAYRVCGDNYGNPYGCSGGVCVNLNGDNNNCGTVGHVCAAGMGCKSGTCIDTTSDDNNCSVVGYACPSGTVCKNSVCVSNGFCGTTGKACPDGTGCKNGTCIDTTHDDLNCSEVGYACPSGTFCKDSWYSRELGI